MKQQIFRAPVPGALTYIDPDGIERWRPEGGKACSPKDQPVSLANGFRIGYTGPAPDWKKLQRDRQQSLTMTGIVEREKTTGTNPMRNVFITSRAESLEANRMRQRPEQIRTVWR